MDIYQKIFEKKILEAAQEAQNNLTEAELKAYLDSISLTFIKETIPEIADDVIASLKEGSKAQLELVRSYHEGFIHRNFERWKEGFDSLELLIIICTEIGGEFNKAHREQATQEQNVQFDLIVRLHARACHIASEILWLLKGGFADAAHARWRALHEVVVTTLFLLKHGNELSIKYWEHEVIESYKAMVQINKVEPRLSIVGFSEDELEECKIARDQLLRKYENNFKGSYGWASDALGIRSPNFSHLEEAVKLDHLRPYYKWASQNVHSNVHGIINKLGLAEVNEADIENALLAGPSNSGMTDPADLTALSLTQISVGLLTIYSNTDTLIMQYVIKKLSSDIGKIFLDIQNN